MSLQNLPDVHPGFLEQRFGSGHPSLDVLRGARGGVGEGRVELLHAVHGVEAAAVEGAVEAVARGQALLPPRTALAAKIKVLKSSYLARKSTSTN